MKLVDQQAQDNNHHENAGGEHQAHDVACSSETDGEERCRHIAKPDSGG